MITANPHSVDLVRCPHLGLHDDSSTALSYPSAWNYCYRAARPTSVSVAHQAKACLCFHYVDCPMIRQEVPRHLPRRLRARAGASGWLPWLAALLLLAVVLLLLLHFYPHLLWLE